MVMKRPMVAFLTQLPLASQSALALLVGLAQDLNGGVDSCQYHTAASRPPANRPLELF